jgi:hypothetical protein
MTTETPELAALREVKEETGYSAKVIKELAGSFAGGTSVAKYFLTEPIGRPTSFDSEETSEIKWATLDDAATLVGMTTNKIGKTRDLAVLEAVRLALRRRHVRARAISNASWAEVCTARTSHRAEKYLRRTVNFSTE